MVLLVQLSLLHIGSSSQWFTTMSHCQCTCAHCVSRHTCFLCWLPLQGRSFFLLQAEQVELGEVVSKGAYGTVMQVKHIDSQHFPASTKYVAKVMNAEKGRAARRSLATEATNLACLSHPAFVMGLGMTLTDPCMLVMEYWPHGHLGRYW